MYSREEYLKRRFNPVEHITAKCTCACSWHEDYPDLKRGEIYRVTHIGVQGSASYVMLEGHHKEYDLGSFDLYENGRLLDDFQIVQDPRFWAPYMRLRCQNEFPKMYNDGMIQQAIPSHLKNIEAEYDVKVLLAVESGSRAWGFESKDSDWDVRFIYVHRPEWYLRVEDQRDVIEHMYADGVDLVGWDLKKALLLFSRSNPSLFEWFNSPTKYYVNTVFENRIKEVEKDFFNPIKVMYHYNSIYNKQNERYLQHENFPIKKFLYYLRGILACKWIETNKTIPPVLFTELVDATVPEQDIREKIEMLVEKKKSREEHDILSLEPQLVDYAKQWADYYNEKIGDFRPDVEKGSIAALDAILYDMATQNT